MKRIQKRTFFNTVFQQVTPWGMRGLVQWVSKTYNNISIIITENGMPDDGKSLQDDVRVNFLKVRYFNTEISELIILEKTTTDGSHGISCLPKNI